MAVKGEIVAQKEWKIEKPFAVFTARLERKMPEGDIYIDVQDSRDKKDYHYPVTLIKKQKEGKEVFLLEFLYARPEKDGIKINALSVDATLWAEIQKTQEAEQKLFTAELEAAKEALRIEAEKIQIETLEFEHHTSSKYEVRKTTPECKNYRLRSDLEKLFEAANKIDCSDSGDELRKDFSTYIAGNEMGEYSLTTLYTIPFQIFKEIVEKNKQNWEEKEAQKMLRKAEKQEKERKENAETLKTASLEDLAVKFYTETIRINGETGGFSRCDEFCDDCCSACTVWSKDAPEDVRSASEIENVRGSGKVYKYRRVCEKSKKLFVEKFPQILQKRREEELSCFAS